MTYAPSPRPTFDGPAAIPYQSITRYLWGDDEAGEVADWIFVSSSYIHQIIYGVPAGQAFRHSDQFRTIFAADLVYYILSGTVALANPVTGEVQRLQTGDAALFRRDTWHHAFSVGSEPLRVLEYFSPPPSKGTSGAYARQQPLLTESRYGRDDLLERWPAAAEEEAASRTLHPVREADILWRLEGKEHPLLVGILASTEHLTVGRIELQPGQKSDLQCHGGDEAIYVLDGRLNVRAFGDGAPSWLELAAQDGAYLPFGTPHQYYNISNAPVTFLFGVSPSYLPPAERQP